MSLVGNVYETGSSRLEFVTTGVESDGQLHEMRVTYDADSPLPPAHLHPAQDERFEVLQGELTFLVDDVVHVVPAGQAIDVPRGAVHQIRNAGDVPAIAMWQTRPALRTAEFHDAVHTSTAAEDWDALTAALREYKDVFVLVPDPFPDV